LSINVNDFKEPVHKRYTHRRIFQGKNRLPVPTRMKKKAREAVYKRDADEIDRIYPARRLNTAQEQYKNKKERSFVDFLPGLR